MIRWLLIVIAPLLAYLVWAWFTAQRQATEASGRRLPAWQRWPWAWLVIGGAALIVAALVVLYPSENRTVGTDYRPARFKDGKVIPGEIRDKEEPGDAGSDGRPGNVPAK